MSGFFLAVVRTSKLRFRFLPLQGESSPRGVHSDTGRLAPELNGLFCLFAIVTVLILIRAVYAQGDGWNPEPDKAGINPAELSDEGRAAFFIMGNASEEVTRVSDYGLKSSFKPASFNILIKDASSRMDAARTAFASALNESGNYSNAVSLSNQAVDLSHQAEDALKAYHNALLNAAFMIAGGICALLVILPIATYFYRKHKRKKEFLRLPKEAMKREEEFRALREMAMNQRSLYPPPSNRK